MTLLTPSERVWLEHIRDTGTTRSEGIEWAKGKLFAEPAGEGRYKLTETGERALLSDDRDRASARTAQRPRRR
jgi:hypothetical protein